MKWQCCGWMIIAVREFFCFNLGKYITGQTSSLIPNYSQQDATFLDLVIFTDALQVSGASHTHHQEHTTVHTASGTVNSNDRVK
jgi:hypothetical protein